jgi:hypothetical protein
MVPYWGISTAWIGDFYFADIEEIMTSLIPSVRCIIYYTTWREIYGQNEIGNPPEPGGYQVDGNFRPGLIRGAVEIQEEVLRKDEPT